MLIDYSASKLIEKPLSSVIESLDYVLYTSSSKHFDSLVFKLEVDGLSQAEIVKSLGRNKTDAVNKFIPMINALRGSIPVKRLNSYSKDQLVFSIKRILAKESDENLRLYLELKLEEVNGASPDASNALLKSTSEPSQPTIEIQAQTPFVKKLIAENRPGVYVYSYPTYLKVDMDSLSTYKVGFSNKVGERIKRQKRQTERPEDLTLVEVYYCDNPKSREREIHAILRAGGFQRITETGGLEWFDCSFILIKTIANAIGLKGLAHN